MSVLRGVSLRVEVEYFVLLRVTEDFWSKSGTFLNPRESGHVNQNSPVDAESRAELACPGGLAGPGSAGGAVGLPLPAVLWPSCSKRGSVFNSRP